MKPETLSRLKEARLAAKLTQADVAKHLGVKNNTISNYENGVTEPDIDTFVAMCSLYGLDFTELLKEAYRFAFSSEETILSRQEKNYIKKYRSLDGYGKDLVDTVLNKEYTRCLAQIQRQELADELAPYTTGKALALYELPVSAGTGVLLQDEQFEFITLPPGPMTEKADFALRVFGDSMEPKFRTGDTILVQQSPSVEPGEIGVFVLNGSGYVKRLGEAGQLVSLNPAYPDIVADDGDSLRCLGRVLGKVEN